MVKSTLEFITLMAVHLSAWDRRGPARRVCVSAGRGSTDSGGGWYLGPPCVVCLGGIQIFEMVKMFRMLDECSGKRVYQDPWSKVKARKRSTLGAFDCTVCSCSGS